MCVKKRCEGTGAFRIVFCLSGDENSLFWLLMIHLEFIRPEGMTIGVQALE
jgi:hypothetical protein